MVQQKQKKRKLEGEYGNLIGKEKLSIGWKKGNAKYLPTQTFRSEKLVWQKQVLRDEWQTPSLASKSILGDANFKSSCPQLPSYPDSGA